MKERREEKYCCAPWNWEPMGGGERGTCVMRKSTLIEKLENKMKKSFESELKKCFVIFGELYGTIC